MTKQIIFLLMFLLLLAQKAAPCECLPRKAVTQEYADAVFVIKGTPVKSDTISVLEEADYKELLRDTSRTIGHFLAYIATTLKVHYVYKGKNVHGTFRILSGWGGADCGFAFEKGKEYIIYAYPTQGFEVDYEGEDEMNRKGILPRIPPLHMEQLYYTSDCWRSDTFRYSEHRALLKLVHK